ncbi:MAG: hypothetical protein ABIG96_05735 [Candidatus Micrarchaeota archaeon]
MEKETKKMERPTGVTIYLVLLALGIIGTVWTLATFSNGAAMVLGAVLTGEMLFAYVLVNGLAEAAQLYGIWLRKQWAVDLTIALLAVQIFLSLGQIPYLDQSMELALASAQGITAAQQAQALEMGRTIGMVGIAITVIISGVFMWVFHKNRAYFSE